ncbi:alpha/beta hydrolase family protein [Pseudoalteromonas luteoviolacea]|uniref:alpha/beta hydrolase family protein n=1 Tax=Pseudoalteromonas luteoviolacea TaxID=43657 RepID=UPI00114F8197|nr:alpha/beta fold hydrolase [Pseudoalteromonas luteoviolacea]TQF67832.1 S9 family peptidase [Pseudoalteromonas luteoviolacea]
MMRLLWFVLGIGAAIVHFDSSAKDTSALPIEAFASLPKVSQYKLSPQGSKYAYVANSKGELYLVIKDLNTGKLYPVTKTDNLNIKLNWFDWVDDSLLLLGVSYTEKEQHIRYTRTELLSYDLNSKNKKTKIVIRPGRNQHDAQFKDNVISMLSNDPEHVLLSIDLRKPNLPDVYKLNVKKAKLKRVKGYKSHVKSWIADRQGNVRMSYHVDDTRIYYRLFDLKTEKWRTVFEHEAFSKDQITVLGFDIDPHIFYIKAIHNDKSSIFKVDSSDPMLPRTLVSHDPDYDVGSYLFYSPVSGAVAKVSGSEYWDEDLKALQASVDQALPDAQNSIQDIDNRGNSYIVYSESKTDSGSYLLGNREKNTIQYLDQEYPHIYGETYIGKKLVVYKTRDNIEIEAYITLPRAYQANLQYPAIILPHGGPYTRDYETFDYWSEFFAHNGYIVFQPNFRGSFGYGFEFAKAAIGGWGKAMQDDLEDAANWLVTNKYSQQDKMCIAGGSYGGYAALMALVKHPDTFRCAASFAGVSDLGLIYWEAERFTNKDIVRKQLGGDRAKLDDVSPVNFAKVIKNPVLLIHGSEDSVVPVRHSRNMAKALKLAGKDFKYIELDEGDHHLSYQPHRITTLEAMLVFFNKQLM